MPETTIAAAAAAAAATAVVVPANIRQLLDQDPYNESSIEPLEAYVLAMILDPTHLYFFDAVRTLVKLYQLFPLPFSISIDNNNSSDADAAAALLWSNRNHRQKFTAMASVLAMQCHTGGDFLALQYMIPTPPPPTTGSSSEGDPSGMTTIQSTIHRCEALLDSCLFVEFWTVYHSELIAAAAAKPTDAPHLVQLLHTAVPGLQRRIASVLALSFHAAPTAAVLAAVHMASVAELESAVAAKSSGFSSVVQSVHATSVAFCESSDNTKRQRVYQEGVSFAAVSSLFQHHNQGRNMNSTSSSAQ